MPRLAQTDIMTHGPAQASMYLVDSFEVYDSGVYTTTSKDYIGMHAVRIVGWGEDDGTPYWTVRPIISPRTNRARPLLTPRAPRNHRSRTLGTRSGTSGDSKATTYFSRSHMLFSPSQNPKFPIRGEDGYVRIERGKDILAIESGVVPGTLEW